MKRSKSLSTPPPSDFTKPPPQRRPGEDWRDGLINAMSDPEQIVEQDELTVTLKDAFPKALYHFLIVPREDINSVSQLSTEKLELLKHIHKLAKDLISRVQTKEPYLMFRFGYHAVPSLKRLHLHIISQDFSSPRMRTQHHWNTFNTEYFMDSETVIDTISKEGHIEVDEEKYEALLNLKMRCNHCKEKFEDIQTLKHHLVVKHAVAGTSSSVFTSSSASTRWRRQSCKY